MNWINPTNYEDAKLSRKKLKSLNSHVSRVVAAMIQLSHYDLKFKWSNDIAHPDMIRITNLPFKAPWHHIDVYSDGYIGYYDHADQLKFEGTTKSSLHTIKLDILGVVKL